MKFSKILDYLYPPRCPVCDRICGKGICDPCRQKLVYIKEDFCLKCGKPLSDSRQEYCADCRKRKHAYLQGRALFSYQGVIRKSLYRLKYANKREYAHYYGEEMAKHLGKWILQKKITKIVPIPLHPARKRQRGYNQAALLARSIGLSMDIPVDEHLLYRVKKTVPQKELTGQERKVNLNGAFAVRRSIRPGERILLVDDIYTTGSTVDAAAECLMRAGSSRIYVITTAIGG